MHTISACVTKWPTYPCSGELQLYKKANPFILCDAEVARISCLLRNCARYENRVDGGTHTHTHTQIKYRNPRCACMARVNDTKVAAAKVAKYGNMGMCNGSSV